MFFTQTLQTGIRYASGLLRGGPLLLGVEVSVLVSESHTLSASPTGLALESGALVTDHVIVNPAEVSVVFSMANAGGGTNAARDVFETFKAMLEGRELVELTTEHHVYENMVITGLSPMHQAPYKGAFTATLNLRQINFVSLDTGGRTSLGLGTITARTGWPVVNGGTVEAGPIRVSLSSGTVSARIGSLTVNSGALNVRSIAAEAARKIRKSIFG